MKQISNKTLTYLLIAAIVVSVGGTMVSINRLNKAMLQPGITGFAGTETGKVNVTIASVSSITIPDAVIDFGSCSPNASTGTNVSSNNSNEWGAPGVCTKAGAAVAESDNITVQNDGNKNINISVKTSAIAGATFIGGTDPGFYYTTRNASNREGCFNITGHGHTSPSNFDGTTGMQLNWQSFVAADTEYLACTNLTYEDSADQFSFFVLLDLPPDAPVAGEQSVTVTFTAANW